MSALPTTTDRIKERRFLSQSIITRLFERQRGLGKNTRASYNYRLFYQTILPNCNFYFKLNFDQKAFLFFLDLKFDLKALKIFFLIQIL